MRRFLRNLRVTRICFGLAAALLLSANSPAQGQQPPLDYTVENTGANFPPPILPDLAHSPIVRQLPDPFVFFNGTRDTSWSAYEQHRNEWMNAIEQNEIGVKPDCHDCTITAAYVPTNSTHGTLTINVTRNGNTLTFTSAIVLPTPSATCVQPANGWAYVIGMGSATGSWPASAFNGSLTPPAGVTVPAAGCAATVVYSLNSITKYTGGGNAGKASGDHTADPFYKLYPEYCAGTCTAANGHPNGSNHGQYAAWIWGVSRLIDAIQIASQQTTNPLPLDTTHSAVTGCSYAGKMAMWSGAFDERIALTIAQENGGGGAPSWRVSHEIETQGSVENINDTSYEWFGSQMHQFDGANVYKMPTDHHELMAMVAPRAMLQTGDGLYYWLGDRSATFDSLATEKVYANYGIGDRFGYYIDTSHFHCVVPAYQQNATEPFINRFMFGQDVPTNLHVSWQLADALQPGAQPTIDPNMWTAWWGTATPKFPDHEIWNNGGDLMLPVNQNLALNTGDTVTTQYGVSMPGSHPAATVKYPYGFSEADVSCPDNTSYTLTIPAVSQSFSIPANDNSVQSSAPGSTKNPGCTSGGQGQTTAGYFFALGIQNPGAGNPGLSGFTTTDGTPATAQTDPLDVTANIADNTTGQGGAWTPAITLNWENPYSCTPPGCPLTPTLTWQAPTTLIYGTQLNSSQLNAMATATQISGLMAPGNTGLLTTNPVPGTFAYSPALGTVLPSGMQTLNVTFTPTNLGTKSTNFTIATASVPILVGTVTITTTGALSKVAGGYQMVVTIKNSGNVTAPNVQLTQATLGGATGGTIPASIGDIASGGSASVTLTFPSSAGADGATVAQRLSGTYNGGTFGGSFRATLP
ncbi:MAG TPA: hypothetical protein VLJ11_10650 [Bryobacteraceae bacterium]|nr:hypothetical protein [Bryobacteraceae bacterium]